jgi:hypothetical protein
MAISRKSLLSSPPPAIHRTPSAIRRPGPALNIATGQVRISRPFGIGKTRIDLATGTIFQSNK